MQWAEVVKDPSLRNLPYKIELNAYGQILMTPHWPIHSEIQSVLQDELGRRLKGGRAVQEYAIQTSAGVRVADVVWRTDERWSRIREVGALPAPIAPEICIEVQSRSNSPAEMIEKRALYFEAGAMEVWVCNEAGELRFFDPSGELDRSILVPSFPLKIQV
jgi:Uma2 family endonuclease